MRPLWIRLVHPATNTDRLPTNPLHAAAIQALCPLTMDQTTKALTIDLQAFDTSTLHTRLGELRRYL